MMRTVVREHHWAPEVMGALYFDGEDYLGLEFWYADVVHVIETMKAAANKGKDNG